MKEIFRNRDHAIVGYYKTLLEAEGIPIMLRNEHITAAGLAEIPIPQFFPYISVINDADYEKAIEILSRITNENAKHSELEIICPSCGETNPGNFEVCFSCGADLPVTG